MKKRLLIVLTIIISLLLFTTTFNFRNVKADSGWDTSYDSYDSGGSWDSYDYSSNSSNSTYEGNSNNTSKTSVIIICLICYAVPLLFCYLSINIDHKKSLLIYLTILLIGFIPFILINSNWIYLYFIIYFIISIFFTIFLLIKYGEHSLFKSKSNS